MECIYFTVSLKAKKSKQEKVKSLKRRLELFYAKTAFSQNSNSLTFHKLCHVEHLARSRRRGNHLLQLLASAASGGGESAAGAPGGGRSGSGTGHGREGVLDRCHHCLVVFVDLRHTSNKHFVSDREQPVVMRCNSLEKSRKILDWIDE